MGRPAAAARGAQVRPCGRTGAPAARSWRAMFTRMPAATMVMTSEDPPKEMNGSGIPVTGRRPITAPTLITVSAAIHDDEADPEQAPEPVGGPRRRPQPEPAERDEQPEHGDRPDQARAPRRSTEKMKSVWALGR